VPTAAESPNEPTSQNRVEQNAATESRANWVWVNGGQPFLVKIKRNQSVVLGSAGHQVQLKRAARHMNGESTQLLSLASTPPRAIVDLLATFQSHVRTSGHTPDFWQKGGLSASTIGDRVRITGDGERDAGGIEILFEEIDTFCQQLEAQVRR
jgi:hypothetical protein